MINDPVPLRLVVVSRSVEDHELFRQAAAAVTPLEIITANTAAAARDKLDGALSADEIETAIAGARAARSRPFTVLLSRPRRGHGLFETDAIGDRPEHVEEARRLVNRSIRVRLPSWVLMVDDSLTMRSIVRKMLAGMRLPLEICEVSDGFAALQMDRDYAIDLVLIDYNMPGFSRT
ncbi:MAG TPA: response regulator [Lacipirellulaceae bacterium]|nr:response regulator [Lacipirellulaceae bacterium]